MIAGVLVVASFAAWLYLLCGRGGFWRCPPTPTGSEGAGLAGEHGTPPHAAPAVAVVVPARNEAPVVEASLRSLLAQSYKGRVSVVLVDDQSTDGTAAAARAAADPAEDRLAVVPGAPPPPGWSGKVWAMQQGLHYLEERPIRPDFVLFADADIVHGPDVLATLVGRVLSHRAVLVSLMARLRCQSVAERLLIPAFVYFFRLLYPFRWVNDPDRPTAAAAGGCMLVDRSALARAGGLQAIRGALIDDCALASLMKSVGAIRLDLTSSVQSLRHYSSLGDIRRMVARSAYAELRYSPLRLAAMVAGMGVVFVVPPLAAVFASGPARLLGAISWAMMAWSYAPMLQFYRLRPVWAPAMPLVAGCYLAFTLDSAIAHYRGRGSVWKGRRYSAPE